LSSAARRRCRASGTRLPTIPAYEYELAHAIPGQEALGAVHAADLPYVFGYLKDWNLAIFTGVDQQLSDLIEDYWTNFAKTGNPNGAGLPVGPQFGATQNYLRFGQDGKPTTMTSLRGATCAAFRSMLDVRTMTSQ
jgi:para-nitrobenzyl esterase